MAASTPDPPRSAMSLLAALSVFVGAGGALLAGSWVSV